VRAPRPGPVLALVAALWACAAPRPTEFVNVTFTPSIETDGYATWRFDLEACRDFDDPRVDDEFVRAHLLEAIRDELERAGYAYAAEGEIDFLVHYELWVADTGGPTALSESARGRILVEDVASGRFVWRGERKAAISRAGSDEEREEQIRLFAHELLRYTRKLSDPE